MISVFCSPTWCSSNRSCSFFAKNKCTQPLFQCQRLLFLTFIESSTHTHTQIKIKRWWMTLFFRKKRALRDILTEREVYLLKKYSNIYLNIYNSLKRLNRTQNEKLKVLSEILCTMGKNLFNNKAFSLELNQFF